MDRINDLEIGEEVQVETGYTNWDRSIDACTHESLLFIFSCFSNRFPPAVFILWVYSITVPRENRKPSPLGSTENRERPQCQGGNKDGSL